MGSVLGYETRGKLAEEELGGIPTENPYGIVYTGFEIVGLLGYARIGAMVRPFLRAPRSWAALPGNGPSSFI